MQSDSRKFAELSPSVYVHFCHRWSPDDYQPSPEAAAVLEHLADSGPLTVTEAAAHFQRSQAATSELLNRLERRGLVERVPDERDQRRHLVWLTPAGLDKTTEIRRCLTPRSSARRSGSGATCWRACAPCCARPANDPRSR